MSRQCFWESYMKPRLILKKISYCSISVPALAQLAITIMNSSGDRAILPEKSGIHWWIQVEANVIAAVAAAFRQ